jgi:hypothetical protein
MTVRVFSDEIRINDEIISIDDLALAVLPEEALVNKEILPLKIEGEDGDTDIFLITDEGDMECQYQIHIACNPTPKNPENWLLQLV